MKSAVESQLRLEGLESDNLLAFLALLGVLYALESAAPTWRPRLAWSLADAPLRPVLVVAEPQTRLAVCEALALGVNEIAKEYCFPAEVSDEKWQKDLNYSAAFSRQLLEGAALRGSHYQMILSALMSDVANSDDDRIIATPFCLMFGQGHQHFLDRLAAVPKLEVPPAQGRKKKTPERDAAQVFYEALFQNWERQDISSSFRWDPAEDVRYALRAANPSDTKSSTQHGANRLAALGLALLTVTPIQRGDRVRLQVLGGQFQRGAFCFFWPIWRGALSLSGIRALLGHPALTSKDGIKKLRYLGIIEILRTRRISVGKFMNFTTAEPVSAPS